ncbi:MAG: beta-galactosidase trimerization domain-containing protein [Planctomycetes bacterium]|nr:beta-galactosidase trimerization domain-containing protein [Planctomycetota bacterium]
MKKIFLGIWLSAVMFLFGNFAIAAWSPMVDLSPGYFEVSQDVVTPHIKWTISDNNERLKVLFICPRSSAREIAELTQRLDLNYEAVLIGWIDTKQLGLPNNIGVDVPGASDAETKIRLDERLKVKYDVIVIANVPWDIFNPDTKEKILNHARKEGNILFVYAPASVKEEVNRIITEKGRVTFLDYPGILPGQLHCLTPPAESIDDYEKSMGMVIRTLFQAANRNVSSLIPGKAVESQPKPKAEKKKTTAVRAFSLVAWDPGMGEDILQKYLIEEEKKWGIDTYSNCGTNEYVAGWLSQFGMKGIPYAAYFHAIEAKKLFDEEFKTELQKKLKDCARAFKKYRTAAAYTLGDENYINISPEGRFTDTPAAIKGFRQFLQNSYGQIEDLNTEWETSYARWEDVQITKDMNEPQQNPSPWFDYRLFIDKSFNEIHRFARDAIKEIDPDARVGADGLEQFSSYGGTNNLWELAQLLDMINVYPYWIHSEKGFNLHAARSFAKPGTMLGIWMGGYPDDRSETVARFLPWKTLFWGFDSMWWFNAGAPGNPYSALNPDFTPTKSFAQTCEEVREIRQGIDKLLLNATRQIDKIGIHYSQRSWHASTLDSGIGNHINNKGVYATKWDNPLLMGHSIVSMEGFITAILDMGYQFNMIATEQIEKEELNNYKVLILPFSESLTETEVVRMKEFVKRGGVLIGDYRIGIRNEHGKILKNGLLDEIFGMDQKSFDVAKHRHGVISGAYGNEYYNVPFEDLTVGTGITVTSGTALGIAEGNVPIFIINKYGDGTAVYLNFGLENYFVMRSKGEEFGLKEILHNIIIDVADIKERIKVLRAQEQYQNAMFHMGIPEPATEVTVFKDGEIEYVGIIKDYRIEDQGMHRLRILLPQRRHVYDLRLKEYVGYVEEFETSLSVGKAQLYALVPQKIKEVDVVGFLSNKYSRPGDK